MMDPQEEQLISLGDIGRIHRKRPGNLRRIARRLGLRLIPRRNGNGRLEDHLALSDYPQLEQAICEGARTSGALTRFYDRAEEGSCRPRGTGYVYLIQLEPDLDPGRFKIGFSADADQRLRQFKAVAPLARLVKKWDSYERWESAAIDCATQGAERVYTEVFRTENMEVVVDRLEHFFRAMPTVGLE